jgi:hypothetical protein
LIIENLATRSALRVEVKATGQQAFHELRDQDLRADILIGFRFGRRLELGTGPIIAAVIKAPGSFVRSQYRLDVRRFGAIPESRK